MAMTPLRLLCVLLFVGACCSNLEIDEIVPEEASPENIHEHDLVSQFSPQSQAEPPAPNVLLTTACHHGSECSFRFKAMHTTNQAQHATDPDQAVASHTIGFDLLVTPHSTLHDGTAKSWLFQAQNLRTEGLKDTSRLGQELSQCRLLLVQDVNSGHVHARLTDQRACSIDAHNMLVGATQQLVSVRGHKSKTEFIQREVDGPDSKDVHYSITSSAVHAKAQHLVHDDTSTSEVAEHLAHVGGTSHSTTTLVENSSVLKHQLLHAQGHVGEANDQGVQTTADGGIKNLGLKTQVRSEVQLISIHPKSSQVTHINGRQTAELTANQFIQYHTSGNQWRHALIKAPPPKDVLVDLTQADMEQHFLKIANGDHTNTDLPKAAQQLAASPKGRHVLAHKIMTAQLGNKKMSARLLGGLGAHLFKSKEEVGDVVAKLVAIAKAENVHSDIREQALVALIQPVCYDHKVAIAALRPLAEVQDAGSPGSVSSMAMHVRHGLMAHSMKCAPESESLLTQHAQFAEESLVQALDDDQPNRAYMFFTALANSKLPRHMPLLAAFQDQNPDQDRLAASATLLQTDKFSYEVHNFAPKQDTLAKAHAEADKNKQEADEKQANRYKRMSKMTPQRWAAAEKEADATRKQPSMKPLGTDVTSEIFKAAKDFEAKKDLAQRTKDGKLTPKERTALEKERADKNKMNSKQSAKIKVAHKNFPGIFALPNSGNVQVKFNALLELYFEHTQSSANRNKGEASKNLFHGVANGKLQTTIWTKKFTLMEMEIDAGWIFQKKSDIKLFTFKLLGVTLYCYPANKGLGAIDGLKAMRSGALPKGASKAFTNQLVGFAKTVFPANTMPALKFGMCSTNQYPTTNQMLELSKDWDTTFLKISMRIQAGPVPLKVDVELLGGVGVKLEAYKVGTDNSVEVHSPTDGRNHSCANTKSWFPFPLTLKFVPYAKSSLKLSGGVDVVAFGVGIGAEINLIQLSVPVVADLFLGGEMTNNGLSIKTVTSAGGGRIFAYVETLLTGKDEIPLFTLTGSSWTWPAGDKWGWYFGDAKKSPLAAGLAAKYTEPVTNEQKLSNCICTITMKKTPPKVLPGQNATAWNKDIIIRQGSIYGAATTYPASGTISTQAEAVSCEGICESVQFMRQPDWSDTCAVSEEKLKIGAGKNTIPHNFCGLMIKAFKTKENPGPDFCNQLHTCQECNDHGSKLVKEWEGQGLGKKKCVWNPGGWYLGSMDSSSDMDTKPKCLPHKQVVDAGLSILAAKTCKAPLECAGINLAGKWSSWDFGVPVKNDTTGLLTNSKDELLTKPNYQVVKDTTCPYKLSTGGRVMKTQKAAQELCEQYTVEYADSKGWLQGAENTRWATPADRKKNICGGVTKSGSSWKLCYMNVPQLTRYQLGFGNSGKRLCLTVEKRDGDNPAKGFVSTSSPTREKYYGSTTYRKVTSEPCEDPTDKNQHGNFYQLWKGETEESRVGKSFIRWHGNMCLTHIPLDKLGLAVNLKLGNCKKNVGLFGISCKEGDDSTCKSDPANKCQGKCKCGFPGGNTWNECLCRMDTTSAGMQVYLASCSSHKTTEEARTAQRQMWGTARQVGKINGKLFDAQSIQPVEDQKYRLTAEGGSGTTGWLSKASDNKFQAYTKQAITDIWNLRAKAGIRAWEQGSTGKGSTILARVADTVKDLRIEQAGNCELSRTDRFDAGLVVSPGSVFGLCSGGLRPSLQGVVNGDANLISWAPAQPLVGASYWKRTSTAAEVTQITRPAGPMTYRVGVCQAGLDDKMEFLDRQEMSCKTGEMITGFSFKTDGCPDKELRPEMGCSKRNDKQSSGVRKLDHSVCFAAKGQPLYTIGYGYYPDGLAVDCGDNAAVAGFNFTWQGCKTDWGRFEYTCEEKLPAQSRVIKFSDTTAYGTMNGLTKMKNAHCPEGSVVSRLEFVADKNVLGIGTGTRIKLRCLGFD